MSDVFNAVNILIFGLHDQRGMTIETLNFITHIIDFWFHRHRDELPWRFGRRVCSYLLRLDPQSTNPIGIEFALSTPLTTIFMEYLRADYPHADPPPPVVITLYPGDTEEPTDGGSVGRYNSTSSSTLSAIEGGMRMMSDLSPEQLTRPIAGETEPVNCVICQYQTQRRTFIVRLPCGHFFRPPCIAQTFYHVNAPNTSRRCPLCRYECGPAPQLPVSKRSLIELEPEEAEERPLKRQHGSEIRYLCRY